MSVYEVILKQGRQEGKLEGIELGKLEGIELGKTEGIEQEKIETIIHGFKNGIQLETLALLTRLPIEKVKNIIEEHFS